jgi:histidyl-tRNA synthetase
VYIASIGANMMKDRMQVAKILWSANISAEYSHHENPKLKKQMDEALAKGFPVMLVFGEGIYIYL